MYYRILDEKGMPLATGSNTTSKVEAANTVIDLLVPQSTDSTVRETLMNLEPEAKVYYVSSLGYTIEESKNPF